MDLSYAGHNPDDANNERHISNMLYITAKHEEMTYSSALLSACTIVCSSFLRATTKSLSFSSSSSTSGLYSSCSSSRCRFSFEKLTSVSEIAFGTMSIISRLTMLKYEWINSSEQHPGGISTVDYVSHKQHALMTSVSIVSRSLSAFCGRMLGGGASIAATPFFLGPVFGAKNEPKKLCSCLASTSRSLLLLTTARGFLGSLAGVGGLLAVRRSVTIAVAYVHRNEHEHKLQSNIPFSV